MPEVFVLPTALPNSYEVWSEWRISLCCFTGLFVNCFISDMFVKILFKRSDEECFNALQKFTGVTINEITIAGSDQNIFCLIQSHLSFCLFTIRLCDLWKVTSTACSLDNKQLHNDYGVFYSLYEVSSLEFADSINSIG